MISPTDAVLYLRGREPPARGGRTLIRLSSATTTMSHRRGQNHYNVTSSWFRSRGRCKE
jgi:hypothetical protein